MKGVISILVPLIAIACACHSNVKKDIHDISGGPGGAGSPIIPQAPEFADTPDDGAMPSPVPPEDQIQVDSKVKRVWLAPPDVLLSSINEFAPNVLGHPEIAVDIKNAGYDAVMLEIMNAVHRKWEGDDHALEGLGKGGGPLDPKEDYTLHNNKTFYEAWEPLRVYFSRNCTGENCSFTKVLEGKGVGVVPYIDLFAISGGEGHPLCDTNKSFTSGGQTKTCPATECAAACVLDVPDENAFDWWNDPFWGGVDSTMRNIGNFVCGGPVPQKAVFLDMESYWGRSGPALSWEYVPIGKTKAGLVRQAYFRGQQIARTLRAACPDIDIVFYTATPGLYDAPNAFLAGLVSVEPIGTGKVYGASSVGDRAREEPRDLDAVRSLNGRYWGRCLEVIKKYGLVSEIDVAEPSKAIDERGDLMLWPSHPYMQFWLGNALFDRDYFDYSRRVRFSDGGLTWFDLPPEYVEEELEILKGLVDTVILYQGSMQFLCGKGSQWCKGDVFGRFWTPQMTFQKEMFPTKVNAANPSAYPFAAEGNPTPLSSVAYYFSPAILQGRTDRIADAVGTLKAPIIAKRMKNDAVPLQVPYFVREPKHWKDVEGKMQWGADELDVTTLEDPWRRRAGDAGEPSMVIEAIPQGGEQGAAVISSSLSKVEKSDSTSIDDFDVDVWFLLSADTDALIVDGANIDIAMSEFQPSPYAGWRWVKIARRFMPSSRLGFTLHSPKGGKTVLGGIRYLTHPPGKREKTSWRDMEMQEWVRGTGWARAETGGIRFDPLLLKKSHDDDGLPFSNELVALPGRLTPGPKELDTYTHFDACIHVQPEGAAKFEVQIPGALNQNSDFTISAAVEGWYKPVGLFTFKKATASKQVSPLEELQWRMRVAPSRGTSAFTIDRIAIVPTKAECPAD